MTEIQPLSVLLPVVHHSYSSNMIHYFSALCVEQVIPTVIASITEVNTKQVLFCFKTILICVTNCANNLCINLNKAQLWHQLQLPTTTARRHRDCPHQEPAAFSNLLMLYLAPNSVLIPQKEHIIHIELCPDKFYRELDSSRNPPGIFLNHSYHDQLNREPLLQETEGKVSS